MPINGFVTISCFNTQPPEGGWQLKRQAFFLSFHSFNTQPPEGGWFCLSL